MSEMNFEEVGDPTHKKYNFACELRFFNTNVNEKIKGTEHQYSRKLALLVPLESDQRTMFLNAWLPDTIGEYFEVPLFIKVPVDSPCRVAIFRGPDQRSERHYLLVMTKGVEDILVKLKEGARFNVQSLPASEEGEIDHAIDSDSGNYDLIDGHKDLDGN
jgi:hypothetical protein